MKRIRRDSQEEEDEHSVFMIPYLLLKQRYRRLSFKYKVAVIAFFLTLIFCIVTGVTLVLCDMFTHDQLLNRKGQPLVQRDCHSRDSSDRKCICEPGFIAIQNSYCQDINECMQVNCSENQFCLNTFGSYQCQCKPGFFADNTSCIDINECQTNTDSCHSNATCSNKQGSYSCKCKQGFRGDGWTCVDTNECQVGIHQCHIHAQCFNNIGSYTCECNDGFRGDGWTCADIDECKEGSHYCSIDAHCWNLLGSHNCSCRSGFSGDGVNCTDIDECLSNPCHGHATCNNHHGNFSCSCNHGYKGNGFLCKKNAGLFIMLPSHPSVPLLSLPLVLLFQLFICDL